MLSLIIEIDLIIVKMDAQDMGKIQLYNKYESLAFLKLCLLMY